MKWKIGIAAAAGTMGVAVVVWAAFFFLSGGYVRQQHFAEAKMAAANLMRDPESVKFRNLVDLNINDSDMKADMVCGEMNGKNFYGAYDGYVKFMYMRNPGAHIVTPSDDATYNICQADGKK